MTSEEDRKLLLLETLVNNQKHMIELLSILNNNVEELILDLKDIKTTHMPSSSSSCPIDDNILLNKRNNNNNDHHHNHHHGLNTNISNCSSSNSSPNDMLMMNNTNTNNHNHNNNNNNNDTHQMHQNQGRISLNSSMDTIDLDSTRQHNSFIDSNNNRLENISPNNESFKSVKTGLREFSTFVSKMVRQEFGCNFLALTRINELDRYTMQRIRDEAISKYLPPGISPQFAWNHAMNSLRQLRHRQCKKARLPL